MAVSSRTLKSAGGGGARGSCAGKMSSAALYGKLWPRNVVVKLVTFFEKSLSVSSNATFEDELLRGSSHTWIAIAPVLFVAPSHVT